MSMNMKRLALCCCAWCVAAGLYAQDGDPVVMRINGKDVSRSEFEYNFNKNNGDNVVDKKTVDEYVDLFVNYKLKVEVRHAHVLQTGIPDVPRPTDPSVFHLSRVGRTGASAVL
mgnify:CR=1 FL=1